jgi:hypothetical protein
MKIEYDENYCCGELMETKNVMDVESKKVSILVYCKHCKDAFEMRRDSFPNKKKDLIMRS